jgi:hypothetical protein
MMGRKCVREAIENNVVEIEADILMQIGKLLREAYGEIVDEGVPDRFAQLLKRLNHSDDASDDASELKRPDDSKGGSK